MSNAQELSLSEGEIDQLLSPVAIRKQAHNIFRLCQSGGTSFSYQADRLQPTVDYVLEVIRSKYPDLNIPFHSRWGHFRVGDSDRVKIFEKLIEKSDSLERARAKLDLVITSVLLDAGAGPDWAYAETETQKSFNRSEGLGVASYHMFCSGVMASDRKSLRADSAGLKKVSTTDLEKYFQVSDKNPLVGVAGRVQLLNNLAAALENKEIFRDGRPGNILDCLQENFGKTIPAPAILRAVLDGLGSIWPGRLSAKGINLGDVWIHSKLGRPGSVDSLVPIHKLSQWLTYSLIEPIVDAGFTVTGVEELTGLAEYRNGGLMLDMGLLQLRDPGDAKREWPPDSELIIEWRSLTVYLLDQIGQMVQQALGKTPAEFPLAKVLEGGTWWAGRFLAKEKRPHAVPPLNIKSDGTVF
jgi:hypothetical protein